VRFTPEANGHTRVDLEHRHLSRHSAGAGAMRTTIESPNGWSGICNSLPSASHTTMRPYQECQ